MKILNSMFTVLNSTVARVIAIAAASLLTTACVNSPLPDGTSAHIYTWDDRSTPVATRIALLDASPGGYYTGNYVFSNLLRTNPTLDADPAAPAVIESCHEDSCYYAVVFPEDYAVGAGGWIQGSVSLTGLSTAMYHQVKELSAGEVRARLDALASMVVVEEEDEGYKAFLTLDTRRVEADREMMEDMVIVEEAADLVASGESPTLLDIINAGATKTKDLNVSSDFVFSDSWDLAVDVDISARNQGPSYLILCSEFSPNGAGYDVSYDNCLLKTVLVDGRFEGSLKMTGTTDTLLITVMSLLAPDDMEQTVWMRDESGSELSVQ